MRELRVQRLEPLGRVEQQRWRVAATRLRERDLRVQQLRTRLLELVQRSRLRHAQQPQRLVGRAGLVLALRRGERPPGPAPRVRRQLGRALVERGAGRQAAPRPRAAGRVLELGGDVLVEPFRRLRAVPRAAIGIDAGVGDRGEHLVDAPLLVRGGRPVHGGPHERMAEAHVGAEVDQAGRLRRSRHAGIDPERGGRLPHHQRIAHRLGRRDQEQEPGRRRQLRQPLLEALLDAAGQRRRAVQAQPARQLGGGQAARQLQQRQRVAVRLGHDPVAHPLVERSRHHGLQQRPRVMVVQTADHERLEPFEMRPGRPAHGQGQPDRLGAEPARDERERLRRCAVEPLRVVHDADQRPFLGHVRQQAQDRQADQEPIRRVAVAHAERRAQRLALRARKALQPIRERRAQLMQPGERELHLRLDARRPGDAAAGRVLHQIAQQRALADAGLAAQQERPARARAHGRHELVQRLALPAPAEQSAPRIRRRRGHAPRLRMPRRDGNRGAPQPVDTRRDACVHGGQRVAGLRALPMATKTPVRPTLSDAQLAEMMDLLRGSDTVELKLTVPASQQRAAIRSLGLDALDAQIRQVVFFDTPDLALDKAGVVVRARRIQGRAGDSVIKLRPVEPELISGDIRRLGGFGVEVDAIPGGFVCSGRLKCEADSDAIRQGMSGDRALRKLFTKEQRALYRDHAPEGIELDDLAVLGPIFVLKLKWQPREFARKMVAEMWLYPDGARIFELSTKCLPGEAFQVAAEARVYLSEHGIDLSGEQQTKTRTALEFFAGELEAGS